jgi:CcmD family protein
MEFPRRISMCNVYLVLAYGLVWGIFTFYAWVIHHRQQRLEREVEDLKKAVAQQ